MRIGRAFFVSLLISSIIVLGVTQYQMYKELDNYRVTLYRIHMRANQAEQNLDLFFQLAPAELERKVKKAVREELDRRSQDPDKL